MTFGNIEAAVYTERDFLAQVLDKIAVLVVVFDLNGKIVRFNCACEATTGYSFEEVVGKSYWDLCLVPEPVEAVTGVLDWHREFPKQWENYWVAKDGTLRLIAWSNNTIVNSSGAVEYIVSTGIDITERRQAEAAIQDIALDAAKVGICDCNLLTGRFQTEAALRKSEKLYRTLAQNFPNGIVLLFDRDLRYTIADGQGLQSIGLSRELMEGKTIWEALPPETCTELEPIYRSVLVGEAIAWEMTFRDRIGYVQALPVKNDRGEIFAGMVVINDITERKIAVDLQTELISSLTESEERFRCLIDQARDGILAINSDGWFVEVNQRACQDLKYTYAELLTLGLWDLDPTWTEERFAEVFKQQTDLRGDDTFEAVIKRKDGSSFPVEIRVGLLEWNHQQYVLALVRDITKRKRAEQLQTGLIEFLQESDERFRQMAQNIRDIFWMRQVNPPQLLYISPAYEEIWGSSCASLYQEPYSFLDAVHPQDRDRAIAAFAQQIQGESTDIEYRIIQTEGAICWVHERGFPIVNQQGEVYRVTGIIEDITERKLAEMALQQAKEELEIRVMERTAALLMANHELQQEITERQQAELALAKSQQQLELFFCQSLDGFFFMMLDEPVRWDDNVDKEKVLDYVFSHQRITKVNDAMLAQYGATQEQFLGLTPQDLFAHDLDYGRQVWKQFFDVGRLHVETNERKLDGTPIWIEGDYICLYDESGRIMGHFGVQRDISDRKQAQQALQESEERFRQLAENIDSVFWMTDPIINQLIYVSPAYEKIWGSSCDELYAAQKSFVNAIHPEDRDRIVAAMSKEIKGEYDEEYRIIRPDGSIRWIRDRAFPVRDRTGIVYRVTGIAEDISDRKIAEQELRQSEERLRLVVQNMPVMLDAYDENSNLIVWNRECERVTGYSVEEIVGNPQAMALLYPDSTYLQQMIDRWNKIGKSFRDWEWQLTCKDGTVKTIAWFSICEQFPIPGWAGWGVGVDISDRKQAEEEIRNALAKEKELNELKTRFITMASHEFRTPLSTILSSADLLEYYVEENSPEKQIQHIQRIQTACLNMSQLLNDVLVIGRAEAGKQEFNPSPLNLVEFCRDLAAEMQLTAGERHNISFELIQDRLPKTKFLCLDQKLLRHILNNLLSNAIKYSPSGGNIYLRLYYQDICVILQVEDEGIGIPPEDEKHLFEPFYRGKNVENISGTGLGLAIVKRSVELHGGKIEFKSQVYRGSTFIVTLPLPSNC